MVLPNRLEGHLPHGHRRGRRCLRRVEQDQRALHRQQTSAPCFLAAGVLWNLKNPTKIRSPKQFVYLIAEKRINAKSCLCDLLNFFLVHAKFLFFSRIKLTITVSYPIGSTWHKH